MTNEMLGQEGDNQISRRKLFKTLGTAVGVAGALVCLATVAIVWRVTSRSFFAADARRAAGPGGASPPPEVCSLP